jgi:NSS family neurotransmitter:Na+ symporter
MDNFYNELNTGKGWNFPKFLQMYLKWILPIVVFALWATGIAKRFF